MDSLEVKYVGRFLGPDEIEAVIVTEQKTPSGGYVFEVTLKSGQKKLLTEKAIALLVTDEAKDYNYLRDHKMFVLIPKIVEVIEEYDVPSGEIPHLIQMMSYELENRFNRALNWMWSKNDSRYVPGFDAMYDATLLMAERVIQEIPKDEPAK